MTTTINAANISIGMQLKNAGLIQGEIRSLQATLKASTPDIDKFTKKMDELDKARSVIDKNYGNDAYARAKGHLEEKYNVGSYKVRQDQAKYLADQLAFEAEQKKLFEHHMAEQAKQDARVRKQQEDQQRYLADQQRAEAEQVKQMERFRQKEHNDKINARIARMKAEDKAARAQVASEDAANAKKDADQARQAKKAADAAQAASDQQIAQRKKDHEEYMKLRKSVETPRERAMRKVDEYNEMLSTGKIYPELHERLVNKTTSEALAKNAPQLAKQPSLFKNLTAAISVNALAWRAWDAAVGVASDSVRRAMDYEKTTAQFKVLTGSMASAKRLLNEMAVIDQESTLNAQNITHGARTLLGYGVSVRQVTPVLRQMSEITMGDADRFQSLALAFGQVTGNGKLMGQEVIQMVNAGFNPLQQIAKDTGKSMAELRSDMEEGRIGVDMVAKAFENATKEGGRFYGMNKEFAKTSAGKFARLQNDYQNIKQGLGEVALDNLMPANAVAYNEVSSALTKIWPAIKAGMSQASFRKALAEAEERKRNPPKPMEPELTAGEKKQIAIDTKFRKEQEDIRKNVQAETAALVMGRLEREKILSYVNETNLELALTVLKDQDNLKFLQQEAALLKEKRMLQGELNAALEYEQSVKDNLFAVGTKEWEQEQERNRKIFDMQVENQLLRDKDQNKKDKDREFDRQVERGKSISDSMRNPEERAVAELAEAQKLLKSGALNQATFDKLGLRLARDVAAGNYTDGLAPAIAQGTAEALSIANQSNDTAKRMQEQKDTLDRMLKAAEKANELAEKAPRLRRAA